MDIDQQAQRIGILGGTFDPVHYGHLVIAEEVRIALNLAKVIFVPAGKPPHKRRTITPAEHRVAMLELALASNPAFSISRIELERSGPSYTVDTLQQLRTQLAPQTELYFIIGWDSLEDLPDWHEPEALLAALTHLVAVRRPGYDDDLVEARSRMLDFEEEATPPDRSSIDADFLDQLEEDVAGIRESLLIVAAPQLEISATDLRKRVAAGKPIKYQTPESVEQYIAMHALYRSTKTKRT